MNELIPVNYENDKPTVLGRDLHMFLEVETPYHKWFPRMCEYGFVEEHDFNTDKNVRVQIEGNREVTREIIDHQLTIEMAKELCMLQRNEKGKQARQYFIQLEKAWNTPEMVMARALRLAENSVNQLKQTNFQLSQELEANKPKVLFADAVCASQTCILVGDLAKLLKQNGISMGQNRLFAYLRDNDYLMKQGSSKNMPTQRSMDMGLLEVKENYINNPDGSIRITRTTKVTGKGQVYFINKLKSV